MTVFATLTALVQKVHSEKGDIASERFLTVCRHIIPITGTQTPERVSWWDGNDLKHDRRW